MPKLTGHLSERYTLLEAIRAPWTDAAERHSLLTIPSVFPEENEPVPDARVIPHNNTGSQGLNTLASKMTLQLLPPNQPFFRMEIKPQLLSRFVVAAASQDASVAGPAGQILTELQESLVDLEQRLIREIGRDNLRANAHELFKQLLIAGNAIFWVPDSGPTSVISLRNFVARRTPAGSLMEVIIREQTEVTALPEDLQPLAAASTEPAPGVGLRPSVEDTVSVYTAAERISNTKFVMWQEIGDKVVPGSVKEYEEDFLPLITLRWTATPNTDYGHSFISEQTEGDLINLEALTKAIKDYSLIASKVVFGVDPSAPPGLAGQLSRARNASFHRFATGQVFALKVDKLGDMNIVAQTADRAEQRLRQSFLLNTTRDAERVTAEEIRQNFQELQTALGGAFSQLSNTFQVPLLRRLMARLRKRGGLAGIDNALQETEPIIITGIDALGRNNEFTNLRLFTDSLAQSLGPQSVMRVVRERELALRYANAIGIKPDRLIRDEQEMVDQQNQASLTEAGIRAAGPAAGAVAKGLASNVPTPPDQG